LEEARSDFVFTVYNQLKKPVGWLDGLIGQWGLPGGTTMLNLEALKSVQFVVGQDGHPSAVQMNIEAWESLLNWLEDTEDRALVKQSLPKLRSHPAQGGALRWDDVKSEWDKPQAR
jgi:hypothetical protein